MANTNIPCVQEFLTAGQHVWWRQTLTLPPGCPTAFDLDFLILASEYDLTTLTASAKDLLSLRSACASAYALALGIVSHRVCANADGFVVVCLQSQPGISLHRRTRI